MKFITISDEAYNEFKDFLVQNEVKDFNIRINLAGVGWGGPVFNIVLDEQSESDLLEKIADINFIAKKELIDEYGGFTILSSEENGSRGLTLKPNNSPESDGCGSCGGGCH